MGSASRVEFSCWISQLCCEANVTLSEKVNVVLGIIQATSLPNTHTHTHAHTHFSTTVFLTPGGQEQKGSFLKFGLPAAI